jgi:tetratricopeptide (TPR) repeat protein
MHMTVDQDSDGVTTLLAHALRASAAGDSEAAIALFRRVIALDDSAASPHYLLGAEFARIGLVDKAAGEMQRALRCDPAMSTARFQLGLLHLTCGRVAEAAKEWEPLLAASRAQPLQLFARGLLLMAQDRFAESRSLLAAGIEADPENDALNGDMRRVIEAIDQVQRQGREEFSASHVLLSTYRSSSGETA